MSSDAHSGGRDLRALLTPRSVVVVGASPRGNRGTTVLRNLRRFGFDGEVFVVHPSATEVEGYRAYARIEDLPYAPDFVVVALGADLAVRSVEQAGALGVRAGVVIASGFGEGGQGADQRADLIAAAHRHDLALCGPNCYGLLNLRTGFAGYSGEIADPLEVGRVALVMQSGALTHSVTDTSVGRGLGLSHLITTGNELFVTIDEYVSALADEPDVSVIGVFLEGIRRPDAFATSLRKARAHGKPVVVLAVGKSELGQRAALAHTGALAGSSAALSAYLEAHGAVQVDDLDAFREALIAVSAPRRPEAPGAAFISISGGGSGLLSDLAESLHVPLPQPDAAARSALSAVLPEFASIANPLDATGAAAENPRLLVDAGAALARTPGLGALALALNVPGGSAGQESFYQEQARQVAALARHTDVPVFALTLAAGSVDPELAAILRQAGVPLLVGARPALSALSAYLRLADHSPLPEREIAKATGDPFGDRDVLAGADAFEVVAGSGIRVPLQVAARTPEEVRAAVIAVGGLAVLKAEVPGLAHKAEIGAVVVGVDEASAVPEAGAMRDRILDRRGEHADFLVQEQVTGELVEVLVGIVRDPQVGLIMSLGLGGTLVELGSDAELAPLPVTPETADAMTRRGALAHILDGYRGRPPLDRAALVETMVAFSDLVVSLDHRVAAAELNPVMVLPDGAIAVDALLVREERDE